eukprot:TRINITY_DN18926_c0_g2_i1.p1 TRINITY_DN18926_c0_g2~~TRINITY_DN18926_c0_g2_i1.p1  ORF type:complete len:455 (+),score=37.54 TRINITY_DN18926_c0_g2_i1:102-1466(+)
MSMHIDEPVTPCKKRRQRSPSIALTPAARRRLRRDAAARYNAGREIQALIQCGKSDVRYTREVLLAARSANLGIKCVPYQDLQDPRFISSAWKPNPSAEEFVPEQCARTSSHDACEMWHDVPPQLSTQVQAASQSEMWQPMPPLVKTAVANEPNLQAAYERKAMELEDLTTRYHSLLAYVNQMTTGPQQEKGHVRPHDSDDVAYEFYCNDCQKGLPWCVCHAAEREDGVYNKFAVCDSCGITELCQFCRVCRALGGLRPCSICGGIGDQDEMVQCDGAACEDFVIAHETCLSLFEHPEYPSGARLCERCFAQGTPFEDHMTDTDRSSIASAAVRSPAGNYNAQLFDALLECIQVDSFVAEVAKTLHGEVPVECHDAQEAPTLIKETLARYLNAMLSVAEHAQDLNYNVSENDASSITVLCRRIVNTIDTGSVADLEMLKREADELMNSLAAKQQ